MSLETLLQTQGVTRLNSPFSRKKRNINVNTSDLMFSNTASFKNQLRKIQESFTPESITPVERTIVSPHKSSAQPIKQDLFDYILTKTRREGPSVSETYSPKINRTSRKLAQRNELLVAEQLTNLIFGTETHMTYAQIELAMRNVNEELEQDFSGIINETMKEHRIQHLDRDVFGGIIAQSLEKPHLTHWKVVSHRISKKRRRQNIEPKFIDFDTQSVNNDKKRRASRRTFERLYKDAEKKEKKIEKLKNSNIIEYSFKPVINDNSHKLAPSYVPCVERLLNKKVSKPKQETKKYSFSPKINPMPEYIHSIRQRALKKGDIERIMEEGIMDRVEESDDGYSNMLNMNDYTPLKYKTPKKQNKRYYDFSVLSPTIPLTPTRLHK
ncbi:hypothetical protein PCE1_002909 [Barthelona sp. PCE]